MLTLAFVALAAGSLAQGTPSLGPAQAVDIGVQSVDWHPKGGALIYAKTEDKDGTGLGFFKPGDKRGKVLFHLAKGDAWRNVWFPSSPTSLVTIFHDVHNGNGDFREGAVYVVDALDGKSYKVYSDAVPASQPFEIEPRISPGLVHAIVDVTKGKQRFHMVLPEGGGDMVPAPEIDAAVQQGYGGPQWSVNGTATYSQGAVADTVSFAASSAIINDTPASTTSTDGGGGLVFTTVADAVPLSLSFTVVRGLNFFAPAPPVGTPVLEVIPANGALRKVPSPGPWVNQIGSEPWGLRMSAASLRYGHAEGKSKSLWLTPAEDKDGDAATMIAAEADQGYISPDLHAVAYLSDNVLFVKAIKG